MSSLCLWYMLMNHLVVHGEALKDISGLAME
jgi:hypothetical protein